jgi:hypothetical protein
MKAILFKREDRYDLYANTDHKLASTALNPFGKLSKENCDEIFGVVDVEKLACEEIKIHIDAYQDIHTKSTEKNASPCTPLHEGGCVGANLYSQVNGFIKGFNKAMELNKEKLFTEDDINLAFVLGKNNDESRINKLINSKIQPTEIEVEIVMERIPDGLDESCHIQYAKVPKLDSEGNLILRKL